MKQSKLTVVLATVTLGVSLWLNWFGFLPRLGIFDDYRVIFGLLVGVPFGSAMGVLLRDRVVFRSFLAALPTAAYLYMPALLYGEGGMWKRIIGAGVLIECSCGLAYWVHYIRTKRRKLNPDTATVQQRATTRYKIFKSTIGALETVKNGWSWPAFHFTAFWALTKRMWFFGVGTIVAVLLSQGALGFLVNAMAQTESHADSGFSVLVATTLLATIGVPLILGIIFGAKGNSWREESLLSRGYEQVGMVAAENPHQALALWSEGDYESKEASSM